MSAIGGNNIQWPSETDYLPNDRGTGAYGVKDISPFIPPQIIATEDFETDPISGSGGGNLPWELTNSNPHTGNRCLRSGPITNSQQSLWTFSVPVGAVALTFWHRVSSEQGFDFFEVYVNSVTPVNRVFQLSGTANIWQQLTIPLAGVTSVIFRYVKDFSDSAGLDAAFIDDLEWGSPEVPAVQKWEPFHLNTDNCLKVDLCDNTVAVTGIVDTRFLDCETDSVTICPGDDPINVVVDNFPATTNLDCETDSVTVCPGENPLNVIVDNFPTAPHLSCETDSVSVCIDEPLDVSVLGTVSFIPAKRPLRGIYYGVYGPQNYGSGADAATAGDLWLVNQDPNIEVRIREVKFAVAIASLALLTSLPTMRLERMTFTGTPSAGLITPAKRDSLDLANVGQLRSANTGMTITPGDPIRHFAPPSSDVIGGLLAANAAAVVPVEQILECDLDSQIVIRQNQGVVLRQNTAGSVTENRRYWVNIVWEEF